MHASVTHFAAHGHRSLRDQIPLPSGRSGNGRGGLPNVESRTHSGRPVVEGESQNVQLWDGACLTYSREVRYARRQVVHFFQFHLPDKLNNFSTGCFSAE